MSTDSSDRQLISVSGQSATTSMTYYETGSSNVYHIYKKSNPFHTYMTDKPHVYTWKTMEDSMQVNEPRVDGARLWWAIFFALLFFVFGVVGGYLFVTYVLPHPTRLLIAAGAVVWSLVMVPYFYRRV